MKIVKHKVILVLAGDDRAVSMTLQKILDLIAKCGHEVSYERKELR